MSSIHNEFYKYVIYNTKHFGGDVRISQINSRTGNVEELVIGGDNNKKYNLYEKLRELYDELKKKPKDYKRIQKFIKNKLNNENGRAHVRENGPAHVKGNENENGPAHVRENGNGNENGPAHVRENGNGNGNENGSAHRNENENGNGSAHVRGNENENGNGNPEIVDWDFVIKKDDDKFKFIRIGKFNNLFLFLGEIKIDDIIYYKYIIFEGFGIVQMMQIIGIRKYKWIFSPYEEREKFIKTKKLYDGLHL